MKLECGCTYNDTHWLHRCDACAALDAETSARWANDRKNPPLVRVHRINGVIQQVQEVPCPEPSPPEPQTGTPPTSTSDSISAAVSEQPTDYSALLSQF